MNDEAEIAAATARAAMMDWKAHAALIGAGAAAVVLRLATHVGPPRNLWEVFWDGVAMLLVGYAVGGMALGLTGSQWLAHGSGVLSGLVGVEAVKRFAASRLRAAEKS